VAFSGLFARRCLEPGLVSLMAGAAGHPPLMPGTMHHYDLHVCVWKKNPAGMFSSTIARRTG
jgi:hypothetical protein